MKFSQSNLFTEEDVEQINGTNIQEKFKRGFHAKFPSSPYVRRKATESYSLQTAIFVTFNQWLDKRMTLANWSCGLDLSLNTYKPPSRFVDNYAQRIDDEKEYRQLMVIYAIYDCFSVTQLANRIEEWEQQTLSAESVGAADNEEQGLQIELHPQDDDWFAVHVLDEPEEPTIEPIRRQECMDEEIPANEGDNQMEERGTVHVQDEPMDLRDDGWVLAGISPSFGPSLDEERPTEGRLVHVQTEPPQVNVSSSLEPSTPALTQRQIRNRAANRRRRGKRYDFEVIRKIFHKFNIRKVKRIMGAMNIDYTNVNIVGHTLFIGLKNQRAVEEVGQQLNNRVFTEQHFRRLYPDDSQ